VLTSIAGAQLVVWVATGFAFTCFDFEAVRGTKDRAPPASVAFDRVRVRPEEAAHTATEGGAAVKSVALKTVDGRPTYVVAFSGTHGEVLIDAERGDVASVNRDAATRIAVGAYRGGARARTVESRREDDRDVFVVHLDDARDTEVTVDALTGDIATWKNRPYRFFDALWSAHVLGYLDRRSPANWPLRVVAFLAVAAIASGVALLLGRLRILTERKTPWLATKSQHSVSGS
jgi:uncharacterized membrane protein YkoI